MDIKKRKEEVNKKFDELKKQLINVETVEARLKEEILRLQGEFRLIEDMEKETPSNIEPKPESMI